MPHLNGLPTEEEEEELARSLPPSPSPLSGVPPQEAQAGASPLSGAGPNQFLQQFQQAPERSFLNRLEGFGAGIQGRLGEFRKSQRGLEKERKTALAADALTAFNFLEAGQPDQALQLIDGRTKMIGQLGGDTSDTQGMAALISGGRLNEAKLQLKTVIDSARGLGLLKKVDADLTTAERDFKAETKGFSKEDKLLTRRIAAGLAPRAIGTGAQTVAALGTAKEVAESEAIIAGAKAGASEAAKLAQQFKMKPKIEFALKTALRDATAAADVAEENRSNAKALDVFNVGVQGLSKALGKTFTGGLWGVIPALTANARTAELAIAAMQPLLKSVFRGAGEGTFSDGDQVVMRNLIPSRRDSPEVRANAFELINNIVRAKLAPETMSATAVADALRVLAPQGGAGAAPGAAQPAATAAATPAQNLDNLSLEELEAMLR